MGLHPTPSMARFRTSDTHPIRVDWLVEAPGRIGLTLAPGKHAPSLTGAPWARDLAADLDRLTGELGVRVLVCLLEAEEMARLRIPTLLEEAAARGLETHWLPIADGGVPPTVEAARALVERLVARAAEGAPVVVHCQGGIGRAGTLGGCALVELGMTTLEALATLKERRDPRSPETGAQADFIARFERSRGERLSGGSASRARVPFARPRAGIVGAVLGAAIGDAMGHPVEFLSREAIHARFGPAGVRGFELYWEREGVRFAPYTDDTQLAEIVLRALVAARAHGEELDATMQRIARGLARWQTEPQGGHRAPGNACLAGARALAAGVPWREAGAPDAGGCGSVMRAYPFGLVWSDDRERAAGWAAEHSRLTHGAPIALAACAAMAVGTALALAGAAPGAVAEAMIAAARRYDAGTAELLVRSRDEALAGVPPETTLERLRGWAAHEAVAAALYVFLRHPDDPAVAILEGANTPGDSDSIATLAGALVGARMGVDALPPGWVRDVERSGALSALALEASL
ncbi:MAG: ADP-ribosylglycohydrolase family protein [Myxococcales bacterium]|nr:ADP-ribosylglycohydrolase family protein [Myxococcales bacterium]